jgi:adenine-specific DNA-methyltransferase
MNRKWIGIEYNGTAFTHCHPRIKAVIDGEQGGISKTVNWKGGGGFKFYELAPTLLEKSKRGNLVISDKYNEEMLSHAMAKHEGYTYAPDGTIFWKQGFSGENNFIFTTTGHLSPEYIDNIASQLSEDDYWLICAESFDATCPNRHKRIIIRPIPKMLLGRCEWGKDNYDLNIIMREVTDWEETEDDCDGEN